MKKSVLVTILTFIATLPLLGRSEIDKNFHQEYDVNEGASLSLKHGDGNVEVTTWTKDVVDINIVYRATFTGMTRIDPKDFEVEFEKRGDHITVVGREPRLIGFGSYRVHEYQYTIKAPAYVSLDINGVDGDVVIQDRENNVKVKSVDGTIELINAAASFVDIESVDGNIRLEKISADVRAETVDGDISLNTVTQTNCRCKSIDGDIYIQNGSGIFTASSVDGDVELLKMSAEVIDAHTSDGRIELELINTDPVEVTLKTSDGNVRVTLATGTSVDIDINTGDGNIRTDLSPVEDLQTDDDKFSGSINGGRGSLSVRTGDGNVSIVEK